MTGVVTDRRRLIETLDTAPIALVLSNPRRDDNPLEVVNSAFCRLTGYEEREIVGRNCRFLTGQDTDPAATAQLRAAIRERRPVLVDILNYRRDGSAFRNGVMITPLFGADGELEWFLGSQVDLEDTLDASLASRRASAADRVAALSNRQREILGLMATGLLNKQIAWRLGISEKTVKMHRALMIERLGVSGSAEAIRVAVEAGL